MLLKNSGSNLTLDSFKLLESAVNAKIPLDYKNFMLQHNGGQPVEHIFFSFNEVDSETGKSFENGADIHSFNKLEDIQMFYDNLVGAEVIPEQYLPIADDSCGNEILMCLVNGTEYGKIFFGNHELYQSDEIHWVLTEIATSFNEFLKIIDVN